MPRKPEDAAAAEAIAKRVGHRVRKLRLRADLTQAELAEALKITLEAYSRIERGAGLPSFPTLLRLCQRLGSTPDRLLREGGDVAKPQAGARVRSRRGLVFRTGADGRPEVVPMFPGRARREDAAATVPATPTPMPRRPTPMAADVWPKFRNPTPPDDGDDPPGLAPHGRRSLAAKEQEQLDWTVEALRRLDRADRAAVRAIVRQLCVRAGILPDYEALFRPPTEADDPSE
jgi:transcriptional regulator with XRE-family HTH domain